MPKVPSYRHHKATGQGVVTLRDAVTGKAHDLYLGQYSTPKSLVKYAETIAAWEASGRRLASVTGVRAGPLEPTVAELAAEFMHFQTSRVSEGEARNLKVAIDLLVGAFGNTLAKDFGPLRMQSLRDMMVERGWKRGTVNKQVGRLTRMFRWGVSREMLPVSVFQSLRSLQGLRRGDSDAPESKPVMPVDTAHVRATLPHLSRQLRAVGPESDERHQRHDGRSGAGGRSNCDRGGGDHIG